MGLLMGNRLHVAKTRHFRLAPMIKPKYYVSSSTGNDTNDGLTEQTAWASLTKLNSAVLQPGDYVALKRGDSFNGTLNVNYSGIVKKPIIYGAYGEGDKPKVYGSDVITGWTLHSGNIYKKVVAGPINQLFINEATAQIARYPKKNFADGFADITGVNSTTQFVSTEIASQGTDYYKNATIFFRSSEWSVHQSLITASTGQTLTLANAPSDGALAAGKGFFLVNKLEFLTEAGEWCFDGATNTVYAWMPNSDSPANYVIRGSVRDFGVNIENKNYVNILNLEILHSADSGIYINASDLVTVNACDITNPSRAGIQTYWNSDFTILTNNRISGANNYGIRTYTNSGVQIIDNHISEIGQLSNIGIHKASAIPGTAWGTGINSQNAPGTIEYNTIENVGYIGIHFAFGLYSVKWNKVDGVCQVIDDGGGIYTYNGTNYTNPGTAGSEVKFNIVMNVHGNIAGSIATAYAAYGIYLDNETHDVTVEDNLIMGATFGTYLHDGGNNIVNRNHYFDCGVGWLLVNQRAASTVTNNKFYLTNRQVIPALWGSSLQPQRFVYESNGASTINDNKYVSPYSEDRVFWNYTDFAAWKAATGQDGNSTYNGTDMPASYTERVIYNDTKTAKTFYLNNSTNVVDAFTGSTITGNFILQPFTWVTVQGLNVDCILDSHDSTAPVIETFTIPATSPTYLTPITSIVAASTTKYLLSENSTTPTLTDSRWTTTTPTNYRFTSNGVKNLYLWVRDAAGNISGAANASVNITSTIPIANAIHLWEFNESSGTNVADSIGTNHGTVVNGATVVAGKLGNARAYNGSTQYTTLTVPSLFNTGLTNDFSISVWVNWDQIRVNNRVFEICLTASDYVQFVVSDAGNSLLAYVKSAGVAYQVGDGAGEVIAGNWTHYVMTWKASTKTLKMYVNAVQKTTPYASSMSAGVAGRFWIGARTSTSQFMLGKTDQFIIFNKELALAEVAGINNLQQGLEFNNW